MNDRENDFPLPIVEDPRIPVGEVHFDRPTPDPASWYISRHPDADNPGWDGDFPGEPGRVVVAPGRASVVGGELDVVPVPCHARGCGNAAEGSIPVEVGFPDRRIEFRPVCVECARAYLRMDAAALAYRGSVSVPIVDPFRLKRAIAAIERGRPIPRDDYNALSELWLLIEERASNAAAGAAREVSLSGSLFDPGKPE